MRAGGMFPSSPARRSEGTRDGRSEGDQSQRDTAAGEAISALVAIPPPVRLRREIGPNRGKEVGCCRPYGARCLKNGSLLPSQWLTGGGMREPSGNEASTPHLPSPCAAQRAPGPLRWARVCGRRAARYRLPSPVAMGPGTRLRVALGMRAGAGRTRPRFEPRSPVVNLETIEMLEQCHELHPQ